MKYFVPGLLITVVCLQFYLVNTHNLSQWKGGGFGMFSTVDMPTERILYAEINTPKEESIPIIFPFSNEFNVLKEKVKSFPTTNNIDEILERLKQEDWYCDVLASDLTDNLDFDHKPDDTCLMAATESMVANPIEKLEIEEFSIDILRLEYDLSSSITQLESIINSD